MQHLRRAQWIRRWHLHHLGTNTAQGCRQWEAEPHRRQRTTDSHNVRVALSFRSRLPCTLTCFKLWALGIGFLEILLKFLNLRRDTCFVCLHHAYLEQQLVFHKRKPLWNPVKSTILSQSIFPTLYPLCVVLSLIKANFLPPHILRIRASNLSAGSSVWWETLACSVCCCRLPWAWHPDTSWHLVLTHFIIGAQKNTVLGPEGRWDKRS